MTIARWRKLLGGTKTTLAGGLEVRYQPVRGGPARMMTPELAAGAAMAVLHGGADAVYLFNYFAKGHALGKQWTMPKYNAVLRAMRSIESLDKLPRRHALTYRDVLAPGEPPDDPLPAVGRTCTFRIQTGPKPAASRKVELLLEFAKAPSAPPRVRVNDTECPEPLKPRGQLVVYSIPAAALADGAQRVETEAGGKEPVKIVRAELAIGGSD